MVKDINKSKANLKLSVRFANSMLVFGVFTSLLIIVYCLYRLFVPVYYFGSPDKSLLKFYVICVLISGVVASYLIICLQLSNRWKITSVFLLILGIGSVYIFETYLFFFREEIQHAKAIAEEFGAEYDTRMRIEVLKDLKKTGVEAYPAINPSFFIASNGIKGENGRIYPLGDRSNINVIFGNDSGYYPIINTDEHGFPNPNGLYRNGAVDVVLTGDSIAAGQGVRSDENIGSMLLGFGLNGLSIGSDGNGPLIELAALKEYAEPLKPKAVLWIYSPNDLRGLKTEMGSSILRAYLDDSGFTQSLMSRQGEIDSSLEKLVQGEEVANHWAVRIIKLYNVRKKFSLLNNISTPSNVNVTEQELVIFENVLQKASKMVSGWGGVLYFVYLPSFSRYHTGNEDDFRAFVLRTATAVGLQVIDIHKEVFSIHPDPLSLFPFRGRINPLLGRCVNNYSSKGYYLVAEAINNRLKGNVVLSSKGK